jgi:hypothetical protein
MGGISQGAEDIKDGTDSYFTPGTGGVFHRRVEDGSKHKTDASFLYTLLNVFGIEVNSDAQLFQYIGAAALAGSGAITVFGHFDTGTGSYEGSRRGDIKGIQSVPSRPHNI